MLINTFDGYGIKNTVSSVKQINPTAAVDGAENGSSQQVLSSADLGSAVKKLNDFIAPALQSIQFSLENGDSGQLIVKVVDTTNQKVLRQIPNEEVLAISKSLDKMQGLVIKQTA